MGECPDTSSTKQQGKNDTGGVVSRSPPRGTYLVKIYALTNRAQYILITKRLEQQQCF
jgi:hypothetical protein